MAGRSPYRRYFLCLDAAYLGVGGDFAVRRDAERGGVGVMMVLRPPMLEYKPPPLFPPSSSIISSEFQSTKFYTVQGITRILFCHIACIISVEEAVLRI